MRTIRHSARARHPESEFAYGRNEESPDSEQIELTMPKGITAKLCERGANSRRI